MRFFIPILVFSFVLRTSAQVYPNAVVLKHVQVMFEYPQVKNADLYKLQIAKNVLPFEKNIIFEGQDSSTAQLVKNKLKFGNNYKWRYIAFSKGKKIATSGEYAFEIASTKVEKFFRANITKYDSTKAKEGLIFLDHGVVIDRNGNLVLVSDSFGVEKRDFSLTNTGSITYVQRNKAYDRNINGELLWESAELKKENAIVNGYHHDVTKLNNGHYLVMCKITEPENKKFRKKYDEGIAEVDEKNNLIWLWKENDHIPDTSHIETTHSNSIFLDEKKDKVIVSARDINTIFFIDRKSGKIEKCIGRKITNDCEHYTQAWFAGQHAAQLSSNGNILLFNNNARPPEPGGTSGVFEINDPSPQNKEVALQFFYFYDFGRGENHCAKGGDVNKLDNGNYLISSSAYNRNFEITPASEIVWECRPEVTDSVSKIWQGVGSYRINYTPTLYPSFYTLEAIYTGDKITGYKIFNKGFNDDEYEISIKDNHGKIIEQSKKTITSGKNSKFIVTSNVTDNVVSKSDQKKVKELKIN